jgi:hypothetical protein
MSFKDYVEEMQKEPVPVAEPLSEKMWFDYRQRGNKKVKKWHTDRKNFRIQINKKTGQPKEVFISPTERLKRRIGQRKAALKRKSKQRNITAKRLRSFGVRTKYGMKYNTKGHTAKRAGHGAMDPYAEHKGLYPNMMEQLLLEFPHVEILPDVFWDFYEERSTDEKNWLMQLVSLYRDKKMVSMNQGDPKDNNRACELENQKGVIEVTQADLEKITYTLCQELWFLQYARKAYKELSEEDRELFDPYVDDRLLVKIADPDLF